MHAALVEQWDAIVLSQPSDWSTLFLELRLRALTALERALESTGARDPFRLPLGAIGALRIERERRAQPCLLPEEDLARLTRACHGAEPPVRRRQRDEREQHEVCDELELEAAQLDPPDLKRNVLPADSRSREGCRREGVTT